MLLWFGRYYQSHSHHLTSTLERASFFQERDACCYAHNQRIPGLSQADHISFNLIGLPTYPSAYDKFLIVVGLGFNFMTVWYA